ncbi:MAG: transcription termination factor NusA [Candidatus Stygibacter australis]|nr:transcription termination factor NusA [Candidatus Stygibacter australis]
MSTNLMGSLAALANLKQLGLEEIEEIIKESIDGAVSKKLTSENELEVITDFKTGIIEIRFVRIVVERDMNLGEISLEEAQERNQHLELGDKITAKLSLIDFEPKMIKTIRRSILERMKALEEDRIRGDFERQKNQIVMGKVTKSDYNGYSVDIGYAEALLPPDEQIDEEYYKPGDMIRAYVIDIRKRKTDSMIILSRTSPEFVMKLFEMEIPEISTQEIVIKKIVREPGIKTKVAVEAINKAIDPTAACLGPKGVRIDIIRKELNDELVDIVIWDNSPEQLVANAIGPDLVERVYLADRGKFARVIVDIKNKNQAIGKKGKNVKLAAKLTDFKLDIYTESEFEDKIAEERRVTSHISDLDGVTSKLAEILKRYGYTSVQDVFEASVDELCNLEGLGKKTAQKLKESAEYF